MVNTRLSDACRVVVARHKLGNLLLDDLSGTRSLETGDVSMDWVWRILADWSGRTVVSSVDITEKQDCVNLSGDKI